MTVHLGVNGRPIGLKTVHFKDRPVCLLQFEMMKSYDFYTDLFIPQLRYDPIGTNSIYLNSITSVYKEDSLKLEVITGREDFVAAYTVLAIEFENLKGETTGKIEIPAEEVNTRGYKI